MAREDLINRLVELYTPHTPGEHAFVNQHIVQKTDYVPGHPEMNDVYNARKVQTYTRSVGSGTERNHKVPGESFAPAGKTVNTRYNQDHGYMPGEDAAVAFPKPHGNLNESDYIRGVKPSARPYADMSAGDHKRTLRFGKTSGKGDTAVHASETKRKGGNTKRWKGIKTVYHSPSWKPYGHPSARPDVKEEVVDESVKDFITKGKFRKTRLRDSSGKRIGTAYRIGKYHFINTKDKRGSTWKTYKSDAHDSNTHKDLEDALGPKQQPQQTHPFSHFMPRVAEAFTLRKAPTKITYSKDGVDPELAKHIYSGPKTYKLQKTYKPSAMTMPKIPEKDSADFKKKINHLGESGDWNEKMKKKKKKFDAGNVRDSKVNESMNINETASETFFKKLNTVFQKHNLEADVADSMRGAGMVWGHHANDSEERFHTIHWDHKGYHLNSVIDPKNKFDGKSKPQYSSKNEDDFISNIDHLIGNYKKVNKIK